MKNERCTVVPGNPATTSTKIKLERIEESIGMESLVKKAAEQKNIIEINIS
jgi:hypothetical protein